VAGAFYSELAHGRTVKRTIYLLLGLVATALAIAIVVTRHTGLWQLLVFAAAPDLALLYGTAPGLARGQLHPRAVPFYNAVHRFWAPGVLLVMAVALNLPAWQAAGLAWSAHIGFDRFFGFGLRTAEGFQRAPSHNPLVP
jgi:hypothetical protein